MRNWKKVTIPDILFYQEGPGVRKFQFRDKGIKLLNGGNINNNKLDLGTTKIFIDEKEATGKYKHFLVDEGDLVIASSGVLVDNFHKKIAFVGRDHLPLCMNTSTIRFKALDERLLDIRYFKFFLQSKTFTSQLRRLITGSAQLNFGPSHLKQIEVLLPDILYQRNIANILSKAEALINQRKESIRLLDEFLKTTFLEMFGDPLLNPHKFPIRKLEEFYVNPKDGTKCGPFGSALKKHEYLSEGVPVWVMDNISKDGKFIEKGCLRISEKKFKSLESYNVINGDIIISRAGTVGKMCVVNGDFESSIISTNLIRVRFGKDLLPIHFVSLMNYCKARMARLRTGADDTFTHMNTGVLDSIKFPYPPIELQSKFVQIVRKIGAKKTRYQTSLKELENLYGSLSQRAFKGELNVNSGVSLIAEDQ